MDSSPFTFRIKAVLLSETLNPSDTIILTIFKVYMWGIFCYNIHRIYKFLLLY